MWTTCTIRPSRSSVSFAIAAIDAFLRSTKLKTAYSCHSEFGRLPKTVEHGWSKRSSAARTATRALSAVCLHECHSQIRDIKSRSVRRDEHPTQSCLLSMDSILHRLQSPCWSRTRSSPSTRPSQQSPLVFRAAQQVLLRFTSADFLHTIPQSLTRSNSFLHFLVFGVAHHVRLRYQCRRNTIDRNTLLGDIIR